MEDAFEGRKAWRGPGKRYFGRRFDGMSHFASAGACNAARQKKVNFHLL